VGGTGVVLDVGNSEGDSVCDLLGAVLSVPVVGADETDCGVGGAFVASTGVGEGPLEVGLLLGLSLGGSDGEALVKALLASGVGKEVIISEVGGAVPEGDSDGDSLGDSDGQALGEALLGSGVRKEVIISEDGGTVSAGDSDRDLLGLSLGLADGTSLDASGGVGGIFLGRA